MIFFNRYEVERLIGRGSAGAVYLCRDTLLGSLRVAVKVLPSWLLDDPRQCARIATEALVLRKLESQYTVKCYDFLSNKECVAIVMEYFEGETLRTLINSKTELSIAKKYSLARQLLQGLSHIHEGGLVHRDIKPENIIISTDGLLKIVDFGLITSKGTDKDVPLIRNTEQTSSVVGTSYYLSPDMLEGEGVTQHADVYAATMVLFELLTGQDLFKDEGIYQLFQNKASSNFESAFLSLSEDLQDFITRGTAPKLKDRFKNAKEMLREFKKITVDSGIIRREDFIDISEQPTTSCAFVVSSPIVSGAYKSAKTVQFSLSKLLRSANRPLRRWFVRLQWSVLVVALLSVVGFASLEMVPNSDAIVNAIQNFYYENKGLLNILDQGVSVSENYRVIK